MQCNIPPISNVYNGVLLIPTLLSVLFVFIKFPSIVKFVETNDNPVTVVLEVIPPSTSKATVGFY